MILGNRSCVTLPPGRRTAASMQSYCGGGKLVHFSDLFCLTGTLLASKDRNNELDFPLASLRTPKSGGFRASPVDKGGKFATDVAAFAAHSLYLSTGKNITR